MKFAIASDHAGLDYKIEICSFLKENSIDFIDFGTYEKESVDYPSYAALVCHSILSGEATLGVLICGSGIGMSIAANRYKNIRAALCSTGLEAHLSRSHNDSNILCLGSRIIGLSQALDCLKQFILTDFEGGRHQRRIDMLDSLS